MTEFVYQITVLTSVILMQVVAVAYVHSAWRRKTHPVPATWILIWMTMLLSQWMYWGNPQSSLTANIGVTSCLINTSIILTGIIAAHMRDGTLRIAFDKVQKWCLAAGVAVMLVWFMTDERLACYVLVQVIAMCGYIAMIHRLLTASQSTEPLWAWTISLIGGLSAVYPAWVKSDVFAWIFLARSVPSTLLVIILIIWANRRKDKDVAMVVASFL